MSESPPIPNWPRWLALYLPPQWSIYKQLAEEFWLPTMLAGIIAGVKYYFFGGNVLALFGTSWVLAFFWTNSYVRISRQQREDTTIKTLGDEVKKIATAIISISEKLPNMEAARPMLYDLAQSTLTANTALQEFSSTTPSEGAFLAGGEYPRFVLRLPPEQEEKLRLIIKKSE